MPRTRFEMLSPAEISSVRVRRGSKPDIKFQAGIRFQTLVINMSCYLSYLQDMFKGDGGKWELPCHLTAADVARLCHNYDFVVNCSGLGSQDLANDKNLVPKQGVVLHLPPIEEIKDITLIHTGIFDNTPVYVVPRGGPVCDTVLGGTITLKSGMPRPKHVPWRELAGEPPGIQADAKNILDLCRATIEILAEYEPLTVSVGYRPVRISGDPGSSSERTAPVRLEPETVGPLVGRLLHNYGHGGGGITFSWGCAAEVCRWVEWLRNAD